MLSCEYGMMYADGPDMSNNVSNPLSQSSRGLASRRRLGVGEIDHANAVDYHVWQTVVALTAGRS